jgi:ribosomal protein S18 acetylase RimI-like enzyme
MSNHHNPIGSADDILNHRDDYRHCNVCIDYHFCCGSDFSKRILPVPLTLHIANSMDRRRIARIRAPEGMGRFVHFNWFWLDRAIDDPAITFALIRSGARGGITGCIAYGPHERIDLDPMSRVPSVGEIYHIVVDRKHACRGIGPAAIAAAITAMRAHDRTMASVRVSHHAENTVAAKLYARLGFVPVGDKVDGETGIHDRLLELPLSSIEIPRQGSRAVMAGASVRIESALCRGDRL